MLLKLRASASSGWLPAAALAIAVVAVLVRYDTPIPQMLAFFVYVAVGIALPGMLWVRFLRGRAAHISEDLTLGLATGYAVEIATYIVARAAGLPLAFLAWPIVTLALFAVVPALRGCWRGSGERAPAWWSWSLAAMLGFLLLYSGASYFAVHHLTGNDTPYVDMPYHLALISELRHHVPPAIPWVEGEPLNYHWFFYAEAAATSWATGIEPVVLLYRLSGLPMFLAFVVLTAAAARRLTTGWWGGPVAVAIALFGIVADPFGWVGTPVFDSQTLPASWISPTNLFGLALFAAANLLFIDLLRSEGPVTRRSWLLIVIVVFGTAGAKASLLPVLLVGLVTVLVGIAIVRRRLERRAAASLVLAVVALGAATVLMYHGVTGGFVIGLESLRGFPVVGRPSAGGTPGLSKLIVPVVGWLVALALWSFLWAGAYGLLARRRGAAADASILLLIGICVGALGAVTLLSYPGLSQIYYLRGAAGAFGLLVTAGIAAVVPIRARYGPLLVAVAVAALAGAATVLAIEAIGPTKSPTVVATHLSGVLVAMVLPVAALFAVAVIAWLVLRRLEPGRAALAGAVPLLVIALVMGFSLPNAVRLMRAPFSQPPTSNTAVPGDGIAVAEWLRDHSGEDDLVATNLHCREPDDPSVCDARNFWVSAYSERHMLVEGWAYTTRATTRAAAMDVSFSTVPFWDPALLERNDAAFTDPTPASLADLRDGNGVRWLFADLTDADAAGLAQVADLREQMGDYAVYELRKGS